MGWDLNSLYEPGAHRTTRNHPRDRVPLFRVKLLRRYGISRDRVTLKFVNDSPPWIPVDAISGAQILVLAWTYLCGRTIVTAKVRRSALLQKPRYPPAISDLSANGAR